MNKPQRAAHAAILERYPDAWLYRMMPLDHPPGLSWWQRLLRRRPIAYWITMHDHSHKLVIVPGVTSWLGLGEAHLWTQDFIDGKAGPRGR